MRAAPPFASLVAPTRCRLSPLRTAREYAGRRSCHLGGVIVGSRCGIWYVLSRTQVIAIASAGTTIVVSVQGWTLEEVRELFDHVEAAKNARPLLVQRTKQSP